MIKTFQLFLATASLGLTAAGAMAQDAKTFALVQINQQALFFNQMNEGAQAAADAAGAELLIFNANNDPAAQNSAIETYITEGVDGIIVVAIDVNGIMPAVHPGRRGRHPGRRRRRDPPRGPAEGADRRRQRQGAGADIGKYFVDYVAGDGGGQARRRRRAQLLHPERPPGGLRGGRSPARRASTIAGIVDGQNVQDIALAAAENLMTAQPRHDGDLRHRRAGAARRRRRGREPGPAGQRRACSAGT